MNRFPEAKEIIIVSPARKAGEETKGHGKVEVEVKREDLALLSD
jgi:hypothetical protein